MVQTNEDIAAEIRDLVAQRRLCIFVGAGLSAGVVPTWRPFVDQVIEHVGLRLIDGHEWSTARLKHLVDACAELDVDGFTRGLVAALKKSREQMRTAVNLIVKLQPPILITTNYDAALLETVRNQEYPNAYAYPDMNAAHVADQSVCYIHGRFNFENPGASVAQLVLGHHSFQAAYAQVGPAHLYIRRLLETRQVLFIGFNPTEEHFAKLLRFMEVEREGKRKLNATGFGPAAMTHYAILPQFSEHYFAEQYRRAHSHGSEPTSSDLQMFKATQPENLAIEGSRQLGLRVLTYDVADNGSHDSLDELLRGWVRLNPNTRSPDFGQIAPRETVEGRS